MVWKQSIRRRMLVGFLIVVACIAAWTVINRVLNPVSLKEHAINTKDWIAFVHSDENADEDIYMMAADGSNLRPVIQEPLRQFDPVWAPSGYRIVYMGETKRSDSGDNQIYPQLYISDPTGSPRKPMTYSQGAKACPVFVPSGEDVLYTNQGMILTVNLTSGHSEQILPPIEQKQVWSNTMPGGKVQFSQPYSNGKSPELYAVQDLENAQALVSYMPDTAEADHKSGDAHETSDEANPSMALSANQPKPIMGGETVNLAATADGTRLAFSVLSVDHKQTGIMKRELITGEDELLWKGSSKQIPGKLVWSQDGSTIAIEMWREGADGELLRAGVGVFALGSQNVVMAAKGDAGSPTLSPDGNRLAYVVYRNGGRDIWCCNSDGTNPKNLTKGKGDCYDPKWSPWTPKTK